MINSMTGFSRAIGHDDDCRWAWELKSVNARGLDVRLRTPSGFDAVERAVRDALAKRFKRGAFNAALTITRLDGQSETRINHALLDQLVALSKEYGGGTPEMGSLVGVRGVIEQVEHEDDEAALK
ncbi:MAG: YicC/YloC family endoribonuclease, partial [Alphaproteobacteria bacterium]